MASSGSITRTRPLTTRRRSRRCELERLCYSGLFPPDARQTNAVVAGESQQCWYLAGTLSPGLSLSFSLYLCQPPVWSSPLARVAPSRGKSRLLLPESRGADVGSVVSRRRGGVSWRRGAMTARLGLEVTLRLRSLPPSLPSINGSNLLRWYASSYYAAAKLRDDVASP